MDSSNAIRKHVYDLTNEDLQRFSIWEFASDEEGEEGQDETTVRPWEGAEPPDKTSCPLVVRARFALADGTRHNGYVTFDVRGTSIESVQPVIVTEAGQVMFWFGVLVPSCGAIDAAYAKLGRTAEFAFPIQYTSVAPIAADPITGSIDGFCHYRSVRDRTIVALT